MVFMKYNTDTYRANPFTFGGLAQDDAFVDREPELAALAGDLRSGQDVVLLAPRRYGKSSLAFRAMQDAGAEGVLVAYCDLLRTPTKERLAGALARAIASDLLSPVDGLVERAAAVVRGLRVRPSLEIDPDGASVRFTFEAVRNRQDIDDTLERLLELPGEIAAERGRRVALVLDEFQEVVRLDPALPNLMRAVFQTQAEVAHVYLGSRQHVMATLFADRNEPFWRSARHMELGRIPHAPFAAFLAERFRATERDADTEAIDLLLELTDGHPYATQELAFFTWGRVPHGHHTRADDVRDGLGDVLRAEHNNLERIWDAATANERLVLLALRHGPVALFSEETRRTHGLPSATFVQRAAKGLVRDEVIERHPDGGYALAEPFLAPWLDRLSPTAWDEGDP
jgi:hypothetical protein